MVSKLTKKPEKRSTGMAVTGPTKVATCGTNEQKSIQKLTMDSLQKIIKNYVAEPEI